MGIYIFTGPYGSLSCIGNNFSSSITCDWAAVYVVAENICCRNLLKLFFSQLNNESSVIRC